jgi:outer membrane protein assembly factor BamB
MLLATIAIPVDASVDDDTCAVLFDFGNGQIGWADVEVDEGMNAFNVTTEAADMLGLELTINWGTFVYAVDGFEPDAIWSYSWSFFTWNSTTSAWDSSMVGAGDVPASSVTAIAWYFGPWGGEPTATPEYKHPWTSFRSSSLSIGSQNEYAPNHLTLTWQEDLDSGSIESPIVSANGLSYALSSGELNLTTWSHDTNSTLYCLNSTGVVIWSAEIGKGYQTSAPLIFNGKVIVSSADGIVYAFDAEEGTALWTYDTGARESYGVPSPIGVTDHIYVATAYGEIISLTDGGAKDWNLTIGSDIYSSSPSVKDGVLYIGAEDGKLYAIDITAKEVVWSSAIGGKVRGSPMLLDDMIVITYISTVDGSSVGGGVSSVSYDGDVEWTITTGVISTSAVLTGSGIVAIDSAKLYMIDMDGTMLWNVSLGTAFSGGAPTSVNGTIYIVTNEENSRLLAVSETGTIYANITLAPAQYSLCAPTVADGRLYISSDNGYIYVYDLDNIVPMATYSADADDMSGVFNVDVPENTFFTYAWNFGDGNTSTGSSATHEYAEAGTYEASLTVTSPDGSSKTYEFNIVVDEDNETSDDDTVLWVVAILAVIIIAIVAFVMLRRRK